MTYNLTDVSTTRSRRTPVNTVTAGIYGLGIGISLAAVILFESPALRDRMMAIKPTSPPVTTSMPAQDFSGMMSQMETEATQFRNKFNRLTPRIPYLVVDTSANRFELMRGDSLMYQGICSTGSYVLLKAADDREWIFSTPRGRFRIQRKIVAPIWRKPDWAFIEEGLPVPPPNSPERYEAGVLGEYALAIGNGYLIHGTLYTRQLGKPVTHGCVRLGDEELRVVYRSLRLDSPIFIY